MDRVRLGRVLGKGARLAARTAMEAVDAASAPSPQASSGSPPVSQGRTITIDTPRRAERPRASFTAAPLRPALNAARAGITAPLRRASRALWHELTGSFFALFAFSFSVGVWHSRANALSSLPADRHRFYGFCALALLFGYFAVTSFVRARRANR